MWRRICFLVLVGLVALSYSSAQVVCPPAEALAPCTCRDDAYDIYCSEDTDLKAVFDRVTPLIGANVIFEQIRISGQQAVQLPANMTSLKFRRITLEENPRLETIPPEAFNSTHEFTTGLYLVDNNLVSNNETEQQQSLWTFLSKFNRAEVFELQSNAKITQIPDDPFPEPMPNLIKMRFGECQQGMKLKLGSRILANLPNLLVAQILDCGIGLEQLAEDSFEGIVPEVELDLRLNPIAQLPQPIFKVVMDSASALLVGGERCNPVGGDDCLIEKLECDPVSGWLCENEAEYRPKLDGFLCSDPAYNDIWDWCHAQNKSFPAV